MSYQIRMDADFSLNELIRTEIDGKNVAGAQYDAIIWKIRAGYAVLLYGAFTVMGAAGIAVSHAVAYYLTIIGFSLFALYLDLSFVFSRLRLAEDRNALLDLALRLASGASLGPEERATVGALLMNSGERCARPELRAHRCIVLRPVALYGGTALIGTLVVWASA